MKLLHLCLAGLALLLGSAPVAAAAPGPAAEVRLRRGVNILGYDPIWRDPAKGRFKDKHFREIKRRDSISCGSISTPSAT
jgi:endoglucanase